MRLVPGLAEVTTTLAAGWYGAIRAAASVENLDVPCQLTWKDRLDSPNW
jgi:hypothetical protein